MGTVRIFVAAVDFLIAIIFIWFALSKVSDRDGNAISIILATILAMNIFCLL